MMSDSKPKRPARDTGSRDTVLPEPARPDLTRPDSTRPDSTRPDNFAAEAAGAAAPSIIEPATMPAAEPPSPEAASPAVSMIALATGLSDAPEAAAATPPAHPQQAVREDAWTLMFAESQTALSRAFEEAALAMTGLTRSGLAATSEAAVAMLGARTLAEAVEIQAGFARRGVDTMLDGSARLSEIGLKAATEAARPLLARIGAGWTGIAAG